MRNLLGLIQIGPEAKGRPRPLSPFRSFVTAGELQAGARIASPIIIDGFNNQRFKQFWNAADLVEQGGGMTVDLENPFPPGFVGECVDGCSGPRTVRLQLSRAALRRDGEFGFAFDLPVVDKLEFQQMRTWAERYA